MCARPGISCIDWPWPKPIPIQTQALSYPKCWQRVCLCCFRNWDENGHCTAIPISSGVPAGGVGHPCTPLVPEHLTNQDTAVTTRPGVLWLLKLQFWGKLGRANGQIKNAIRTNDKVSEMCQIPLPSNFRDVPALLGNHFHVHVCRSFVHPSCLGCLLQYHSEDALWMGLAIWETVHIFLGTLWGKSVFKNFKQHFLLLNCRVVGKVPWNLGNKRRKWSLLLSKHI